MSEFMDAGAIVHFRGSKGAAVDAIIAALLPWDSLHELGKCPH